MCSLLLYTMTAVVIILATLAIMVNYAIKYVEKRGDK
jgi:multisubunit Na+/H+ antiporter MnhC subunit